MPKPVRTTACVAALLALTLAPATAASAVEVTPTGGVVHVDALRWVDGAPQLETRTATSTAAATRLLRTLQADPQVTSAQTRTRYQLTPTQSRPLTGRGLLTTDPFLRQAYQLTSVDAYGAWTTTRGAGVTVAVLDSGVDATQPELAGRVVQGGNFTTEDAYVVGEHGTEVSTVLAAAYGNGVGAAGVAPEATILAIKVCETDGCGSDAIVAGIRAAVDQGADVINMSLGGSTYNKTLAATVDWAIAQGVVVVAAAGNTGDKGNPVEYPAGFDGVISVSASTTTGTAAAWAQHNDAVDLSAPGEKVVAGAPASQDHAVVGVYGTSFSAPQVAGAAALVRAVAPAADVATVGTWLKGTATPQSWGSGYGTGMLDVAAAVDVAAKSTNSSPVPAPAPVVVERGKRTVRAK
ncbi:S8 family serine peptidase [Kineococcus sp. SYSU DK003]|uniref:S8 family serine peptidase n=1 Tax=Kineococcus sp. SYSU DK003 TaxID=3383124 RepID=UPI003D7DF1EB